MLDSEQLQILAQLIDNTEVYLERLEKSYDKNNAEEFMGFKKEILNIQIKISDLLK